MNKNRKTSHILNVFQFDANGHVILPATLTIGENPHSSDNTSKIPSTAWIRTYVTGLSYLTGNQSITVSGDATGSGTTAITLTLANTAVTPGTYGSTTLVPVVTVDSKGRITSVTTAAISGSLTFTGDVTGSGTTGTSTGLTLAASGVTAGTYTKVTVDSKGRVTVGANASTTDISEGTNLYYTDTRVGTYLTANSYATQSYVGTQIANLVASAPATLDTLNELSVALGNDPNFATSVATSIGTKQAQLNGTGFVKVIGTTVSYDNNTYLTSFTETDPIYVASTWYSTTNNATNWNTAYGWGNHASGGYLTGITSSQVTTALGYTPYNSTNPSGYITGITSSNVTTALGYTPYNSTNPSGYITGITSGNVTTALGYTPYNSTNPSGYISSYTETDTLATVTARGASTATNITLSGGGNLFNGHHYFSPYDADGNHYPHYNVGGNNNGSKLNLRMFSGNGATVRLFSLNGQTGAISWDGNTIYHAGNVPTWNQNTTGTAGSISGFNNPTAAATANTIAYRDGSGDIAAREFVLTAVTVHTVTPSSIVGIYPTTNQVVKFSASAIQTFLGLGSLAYSSATIPTNNNQLTNGAGYITGVTNISGNAGTVTNATFYRQFTVRDDRSDGGDYNLSGRATGLYAIASSGSNGPGYGYLSLIHVANGSDVAFQIAGGYNSDAMYFRGTTALQNGTGYSSWRTVIHSGNYNSYAPTLTGTGASGNWAINSSNITAYTINQSVGTGNSPTFVDIYANEWFRNNNVNEGLYNTASGNHFYSGAASIWNITGASNNAVRLKFRNNHESTLFGCVYADSSPAIGFLSADENWALRIDASKNVQIYGTDLTVGNSTSSNIYMTDTDETTRRIHCNSGRIGFLNSANGWGAYCDNSGNWFANNLSGTNTGDQTNISGNAATATTAPSGINRGDQIHGSSGVTPATSFGSMPSAMSGFTDNWGGGDLPSGMSHVHGIACRHFNNASNNWGWHMVGQYDQPGDLRVRWVNEGTWTGYYQLISSWNIGSQSVSYASTAGSAPNAGNINPYYNSTAGEGYGFRFWNGDESYKLSMGVSAQYQYGPVTDYSIKLHMGSGSGRGITMGITGSTPTFAHNTTSGNTQVAGSFAAGGSVYQGATNQGVINLLSDINVSQTNNYYRLYVPQGYVGYTQNGGMATIRVVWGQGHAGVTYSQEYKLTFGTNHGAGGNYLHSSQVTKTYSDQNPESYGGYLMDQTPAVDFYQDISGGYINFNVKGYHGQNTHRVVSIDITGGCTSTPTLTYYGATSPGGSALTVKDIPYASTSGTAGNITAHTINQSVGSSNSPTFAGITINGATTINRHIDANTAWGNASGNTIFVGWSGGKVVLGNNANGGHDYARDITVASVVSTNPFFCFQDITAFSDARVKDNVEVIDNAIQKVKAIRGVTYTRSDNVDKEKRHAGVIAQEVLKVLPEVVSGSEDSVYSVAYGNMVGLLIEAIKEQQLQIEELKNKLDGLTR